MNRFVAVYGAVSLWGALITAPLAGSAAEIQSGMVTGTAQSAVHRAGAATEADDGPYCPQGLERFVPGEYYYCVGSRALLAGNFEHSRQMLEVAASWGSKQAQLLLGVGYLTGDTGKLNRPLGLAWLQLAAERGDAYFGGMLASAMQHAQPAEKQQASTLVRQMLPEYGDARAAHRAERRYRAERNALVRNEAYGAQVCIAGLTSSQLRAVEDDGGSNADCIGSKPVGMVAKVVDNYADILLEHWTGHVDVGAVEQVKEPATTP